MHDYRRDYSQGFYCEMRELYNRNQTYSSVELKDFLDFENEDSADETEYNPPPMVSPPTPQPSSHSKPALSPVVITISSSPLALSDSTPAPLFSKEEIVCSSIKKEALPETENKKLSQEPILSSPAQKALSTKDTPSTDMKAAVKGEKSNKETNPKVTGLTNKIESKVVNSYSNKTEKPKETKEAAFLRDLRLCKLQKPSIIFVLNLQSRLQKVLAEVWKVGHLILQSELTPIVRTRSSPTFPTLSSKEILSS
ncbi:hypothetical protein DSO57_1015664 [Entomophthora muscae]|uniref:Uncharacterized protein n=1 Tax=Entomophthora muscae TaxID=34485 RepID=A0ACC2UFV4_9FUNG|nr:hypothetical protein DSO57_1015664 [Entomophthora muscae]